MSPRLNRRRLLRRAGCLAAGAVCGGAARARAEGGRAIARRLAAAVARAEQLPALRTLQVAQAGRIEVAEAFRGGGLTRATNIKSVAKTVLAALVGAAIEHGVIADVHQPVAPLLGDLVPPSADPRVGQITIDHLLTMRAGLERTSGRNYGRWVASEDWVRYVLSRPFVDRPGGRMLYSTGSYHLLSAALTRASGRSTLALAREWLGEPLAVDFSGWDRDPQGFYFGGNNMALTPQALLRFGEMYRQRGRYDGQTVLQPQWIDASWTPRTRSRFTDDQYGYGWFMREARGRQVYYAWGYGGQMIHVVPSASLTVAITSDPTRASGRTGYARALHDLVGEEIVAAVAEAAPQPASIHGSGT